MNKSLRLESNWIFLFLFIVSFALNSTLAIYLNPIPGVYDEFAYLIGADLLTQGKFCAEQHPYWQHFEALMMISQPVYCPKYLPLQSMILALGQMLFQKPILGVALIYAITVSVSFWCFQAYFNKKWSLIGSLLLLVNPTLIFSTALTFMGSAGALLGSFLVFGSFGRFLNQLNLSQAIPFSIGSLLLVFSRPYEGFVAIFLCTLFLAYDSISKKLFISYCKKFLFPLFLTSTLGACLILLYNYLTTGDLFRSAYLLYEHTYGFMRPFIFSPPPPPIEFNHAIMENLHIGRNDYFAAYLDSWKDLYMFEADKFKKVLLHSIPTLALGLIFFSYSLLNNYKFKSLTLLATLFYLLALVPVLATHAHYSNPIVAVNLIIVLFLSQSAYQKFKLNQKLWILYALLILAQCEGIYQAYQLKTGRPKAVSEAWQEITKQTEKLPGKHLVFVTYPPKMQASNDLVYNFAPIDEQTIVYARSINPEADESLINYYYTRTVWVYDCTGYECRLTLKPKNY